MHQHKSVTIADVQEKGNVSIETVPLTPLHGMQVLSGNFADLMEMPHCDDYVQLTITDTNPPANAARALHTVFPNCLQTLFGGGSDEGEGFSGADKLPEKADFLSLLQDFYAAQHDGVPLPEAQTVIARRVLEALDQKAGAQ